MKSKWWFLFWTETNKFWQEWTRLLGPTCSLFGSAVITPSQILAWPSGDQPWSSLTSEQKPNLKLVEKWLVLVLVQAVPVQAWMTASKIWWITHQVGPPWPDILNRLGQRTCSGIKWPIFSSFVEQFVYSRLRNKHRATLINFWKKLKEKNKVI